jgi:hypothetical protein
MGFITPKEGWDNASSSPSVIYAQLNERMSASTKILIGIGTLVVLCLGRAYLPAKPVAKAFAHTRQGHLFGAAGARTYNSCSN